MDGWMDECMNGEFDLIGQLLNSRDSSIDVFSFMSST